MPTPPGSVPAEAKPSGANPSAASSRLGDWALDFGALDIALTCFWKSLFLILRAIMDTFLLVYGALVSEALVVTV